MSNKTSFLIPIIFALVILIAVLVAGGVFLSKKTGTDSNQKQTDNTLTATFYDGPLSQHTVVFGVWSGANTDIKAIDLQSGNGYLIAELPFNIKKVSVLSNNELLYIGNVDENTDFGTNLSVYSLTDRVARTVYTAEVGFGIDDYVVSSNSSYISAWEVALSTSKTLAGGKSRVYGTQTALQSSEVSTKHLLYDEVASAYAPVHYPRAVTDNGVIFMDSFMPNVGAGWGYGLSWATFDGKQKANLDNFPNGTYGTQPVLSADGRYLAFAGYDGAKGSGTELVSGIRRALLSPNTVMLLDTSSKTAVPVTSFQNVNTYTNVYWDNSSGDLIVSSLGREESSTGVFRYNLTQQSLSKLQTDTSSAVSNELVSDDAKIIAVLDENKILLGNADTSLTGLGNLGDNYFPTLKNMAVYDPQKNTVSPVRIRDSYMQYITLTPASYFADSNAGVLGVQTVNAQGQVIDPNTLPTGPGFSNLQIETFWLKSGMAATRLNQQSASTKGTKPESKCGELAVVQCTEQGLTEGDPAYESCVKTNKKSNRSVAGACYDSPLYVYGPDGTKVTVKVHTPVYNTLPVSDGNYDMTIKQEGMVVGGQVFDSINFDYTSALRRTELPPRGIVVDRENVSAALSFYAKGLGLNKNETEDLVVYGTNVANSPYVFISFFDDTTSKQILPMTFTPAPDNYVNIVFYFKKLSTKPAVMVPLPVFPSLPVRSGLTVVEVSGIVE